MLKVGGDEVALCREAALAAYSAARGGPVIPPVGEPITLGDFTVSAWHFREADSCPQDDVAAARALAELHRSLVGAPGDLPSLGLRFREVRHLLDDKVATAALSARGRGALLQALASVSDDVGADEIVLHAEPHDGNRMTTAGMVVYFDLEAACTGPLEWDLAYLAEGVAAAVWPDHDRSRCARLRVGVSACVSAYCWRHVTARPNDAEMLWHAQHHLRVVNRSLGGS